MANSGYGKRAVGDEDPHADPDFAHLIPRDAEVAVFIDHLDTGHAMGHKTLAAEHPRYGQQSMRSSLTRITEAGHLRWIKEHITVEDNSMRWVTRTYWSRTPRSREWWADFARQRHGRDVTRDYQPGLARAEDDPAPQSNSAAEPNQAAVPTPEAEPKHSDPTPASGSAPAPAPAEEPSIAYLTLAQLRAADRRMSLSAADCRSLESLAAEWLSRGVTPNDVIRALTDGLPSPVTNPGGLARKRLEAKMPPPKDETAATAPARPLRARVDRVIMACATCDQDERTVKIDLGICEDCRREEAENPVSDEDVTQDVAGVAHLGVTSAYYLKRKLERATGGPVPDTFRPVPIEDKVFYHYRDNRDRIANGLPPRRWNW